MVGCTTSKWPCSDEGMEYESVRMVSSPLTTCLKTENSASNISFALLTGTEKPSQSPDGESLVAFTPCDFKKALTAFTDS